MAKRKKKQARGDWREIRIQATAYQLDLGEIQLTIEKFGPHSDTWLWVGQDLRDAGIASGSTDSEEAARAAAIAWAGQRAPQ